MPSRRHASPASNDRRNFLKAASLASALAAALGAVEVPPPLLQPATTKAAIANAPAAVRRVNTITTLLLEMVDRDGSPVPSFLVV